jgi:Spore coat polysaccharide biosynthesis protein F, CMP-KDO synthetase homolog
MVVNVLAIVQARINSTRFPAKILKKINDVPIIEILLHRLSNSKRIDKIILATSNNIENDILTDIVEKLGFHVFHGSEDDVLSRFYHAANNYIQK